MRIVMKNALGVVVQVQEIFHGQNPVLVLKQVIDKAKVLKDGDTFKFENNEYEDFGKEFKKVFKSLTD